jgi:hypothetical protein
VIRRCPAERSHHGPLRRAPAAHPKAKRRAAHAIRQFLIELAGRDDAT